MYTREAGGSGKEKVTVRSAEPFPGQHVEDMVDRARKNAGPRGASKGKEDDNSEWFLLYACLRGTRVANSAILRVLTWTG